VGCTLSGRAAGVSLSASGVAQAERLGRALANCRLAAIYTSPLERAVQTATAIGRYQAAPLRQVDELLEIDFGAWTGKSFVELAADAAWQHFNTIRSTAVIPGGEQLANVQVRIVSAITRFAGLHAGGVVALVSHGDVLRFALLHYVGATLDDYARFELDPASVSALSLGGHEFRLLVVNALTWRQPPPWRLDEV